MRSNVAGVRAAVATGLRGKAIPRAHGTLSRTPAKLDPSPRPSPLRKGRGGIVASFLANQNSMGKSNLDGSIGNRHC